MLLQENGAGVYVSDAQATIRNTVASGGSYGFIADGFSAQGGRYFNVTIEDSDATDNTYGFYAQWTGAEMILTRCRVSGNKVGLEMIYDSDDFLPPSPRMYVSGSTITGNESGIIGYPAFLSLGNNTLQANTTNGAFSNTVPAQ